MSSDSDHPKHAHFGAIVPHELTGASLGAADPVGEVKLTKEAVRNVLSTSSAKILAKQIPFIGKLLEIVEGVNSEIREEKLKLLLQSYAERFASLEDASKAFQTLLSQRAGLVLMQKVIQIVENGSTDSEWIALLGNVLKSISDSDFASQFDELSYVLAQIAKLSPQALLVLSRYLVWRAVKITGTTTTSGQTASGDWNRQAAEFLAGIQGVQDARMKVRIAHAFQELQSNGLVRLVGERLELTQIGQEVLDHVCKP